MGQQGLFSILKNVFIFQDVLSWAKTRIPPTLEHNMGKYDAIKKAFYLTALDQVEGDYLEFGVFTGSSFACAMRSHRQMRDLSAKPTAFYGFDSFTGFGTVSKEDRHPFYLDSIFRIDERKVRRFIGRKAKGLKWRIVTGYFEKTVKGRACADMGIRKVRILFIDCDMKGPAKVAFDFASQGLQPGTIIIMDDFFSYRGDSTKGVAGAFFEFIRRNPGTRMRELFPYGYGGAAYVVERVNAAPAPSRARRTS